MGRQFSFKNQELFYKLIPLFFLFGVLLSFQLWSTQRAFPSFPLISIEIPNWLDTILQYLFLGLISAFYMKKRWIKVFLAFLLLMLLLDQMRIQPWVYFYSLLLLPFLSNSNKINIKKFHQWCFVGLYIWSGINKLNPNFTHLIFESILVDGLKITNTVSIAALKTFSYSVPLLEIIAGVLLIFKKTRFWGVVFGALGHIFIIYYLLFGLKGNLVVVPWNLFLLFGLFFLFHKDQQTMEIPNATRLKTTLLIALFIFPIGNKIGWIDRAVAFSLYDGQLKSAYLLLEKENAELSQQAYVLENEIEQGKIVGFNSWAFKELNVPFYPERRFVKQLAKNYTSPVIITDLPLWDRTINQQFKTDDEKFSTQKKLGPIVFKEKVWIPNYRIEVP